MFKIGNRKQWLGVILLLALSFFSFQALLRSGYFPMHDDMQAMRLFQLDQCLQDGQIPCRWVPDMGYGYGYPQFLFYAPLPYYLMEIFHLLGISFLGSVKIGFILSFIASGLSMYLLGKSLWGRLGGLIAAVFYIYAPYRASDVYSRGAVGEFWALAFLPLVFWAILKFIKTEKRCYLIYLALAFGGLLLTHNLTSLAFAPIAVGWGLFLIWQYKKKVLLPGLIKSSLLGVGLAAFYVLPMIMEKQYVHVETMTYGYFNYLAHFVSLRQLFFSSFWGYGSSELGPYDDLSFAIGSLHWLLVIVALIVSWWWRKKYHLSTKIVYFLAAVFLFSIFMTHQRSVIIWNALPVMRYFQFPWRFLVFAIFSASLMSGAVVAKLRSKTTALWLGLAVITGVILLNANYFQPHDWYQITDQDKFFGESWEKQLTISIFDYLPIFAQQPPGKKAPEKPLIIDGQAEFITYEKGSNWQKGRVRVDKEAVIRLPLYYFPGFKLWVDGNKAPVTYDNSLGLITFTVVPGEHDIFVKLTRTPIRIIGDVLTLISLLVIIKWVTDERKRKSS